MDDQVQISKSAAFSVAAGQTVKTVLNQQIGDSNILNREVPAGKAAKIIVTLQYEERDA